MNLKSHLIYCAAFIWYLAVPGNLAGQSWEFVKERDGIKVYTRSEENTSLKSYRGETDLHTTMEKISTVIGSIQSFDWWEEGIRELKVLGYEKEKFIKYYLIYDVPWPFTDRDLCVEAKITNDPVTGIRTVRATPIPGLVPEKPDLVRITNYWQQWTMQSEGNGMIHLVLEGSVDPGGAIPSWIVNMVITETPLNIMRNVQKQVEH